MLYVLACAARKRSAHKPSSTAAGAGATRASRYSTFTTFQPISIHGRSDISEPSFAPAAQNPPWK